MERCLVCHQGHYTDKGGCVSCHRGNPLSDRKNVAHYKFVRARYSFVTPGSDNVKQGKSLMEQLGCRRCHVSGRSGNIISVPLDQAGTWRTPEELAKSILRPAEHMPDFRLDDHDIATLVSAIMANARGAGNDTERPAMVRFSGTRRGEDIFSRTCGNCHRMLSPVLGGMGSGNIGPNLSGLFSRYYPKIFGQREGWDRKDLARWLENPRSIRKSTTMRPVTLKETELKELFGILSLPVDASR